MHGASLSITVLIVSLLLTVLFQYWAHKKLRRTRLKEFPAFRHGGLQAMISMVFAFVALVAFVTLIGEIF